MLAFVCRDTPPGACGSGSTMTQHWPNLLCWEVYLRPLRGGGFPLRISGHLAPFGCGALRCEPEACLAFGAAAGACLLAGAFGGPAFSHDRL